MDLVFSWSKNLRCNWRFSTFFRGESYIIGSLKKEKCTMNKQKSIVKYAYHTKLMFTNFIRNLHPQAHVTRNNSKFGCSWIIKQVKWKEEFIQICKSNGLVKDINTF